MPTATFDNKDIKQLSYIFVPHSKHNASMFKVWLAATVASCGLCWWANQITHLQLVSEVAETMEQRRLQQQRELTQMMEKQLERQWQQHQRELAKMMEKYLLKP